MMEFWTIWLFIALAIYYFFSIVSFLGWSKSLLEKKPAPLPITILIPAHNEATTIRGILSDLTVQTIPQNQFQIIVVNDRSTDHTEQVVHEFTHVLPIKVIKISRVPKGMHGKLFAMHLATQELSEGSVVFVDADCRVTPKWLETLIEESGRGGTVGPVFEIWHKPNLWKEVLSLDQACITFAAMGLVARGKPITASTANMLLPISSIQSNFWKEIGTEGTGEDGRILQRQFEKKLPMRAALKIDAGVFTSLAGSFLHTAAARRRWYKDATTYKFEVKIVQLILFFSLVGLLTNLLALLFHPNIFIPIFILLGKYLIDFINLKLLRNTFSNFTYRSLILWSPIQSWLLLLYALLPAPKQKCRGFSG